MNRLKRTVTLNATGTSSLRGRIATALVVAGIAAVAAGIVNLSGQGVAQVEAELTPYGDKIAAIAAEKDLTVQEVEAFFGEWADKKAISATNKPVLLPEQLADQIDAAVAAGKLTADEAAAKRAAITDKPALTDEEIAAKKAAASYDKPTLTLEQWAEKFDAMVAAGTLTAEQAEAKLAWLAAEGDSDT